MLSTIIGTGLTPLAGAAANALRLMAAAEVDRQYRTCLCAPVACIHAGVARVSRCDGESGS